MLDVAKSQETIEHLARLIAMRGTVLPVPTALLPGEGLRDAVLRAVERNGFRDSTIAIELAKTRSFRTTAGIAHGTRDDIDRLVDILGVRKTAETTHQMLSQAPASGRDWVSFFGVNVRRGHFSGARRVSPRSLRTHGHQKAIWSLKPIGFDPETRERLLDRCPICRRRLGWSRTYGVTHCDHCVLADGHQGAVDLRDFPQPLVEVDDEQGLRFVTHLIDPERLDRLAHTPLHGDLADRSRGELFQFAVQLAGVWQRAEKNPGVALEPSSLAVAGRAILGWPDAFDKLVTVVSGDGPAEPDQGSALIRQLQFDPLLVPGLRQVLKRRFDHHLRKKIGRVNVQRGAEIRYQFSTDRPLRHARHELRRLALNSAPNAEIAVKILRDAPEGRQVSSLLGLPIPFLIDLYDAGMLPELVCILGAVRMPHHDLWKPTLLEKIRKGVLTSAGAINSLMALGMGMSHMDGSRWAQIFHAIADGRVIASRRVHGEAFEVKNLYVGKKHALEVILQIHRQASATTDVPLRQCEVALALGTSRVMVRCLIEHELLPSNPTIANIAEFRRYWIMASEIRSGFFFEDGAKPSILRTLHASSISRQSIGLTTVWSRAGLCELFGIADHFLK
jgi:hypothetical protein